MTAVPRTLLLLLLSAMPAIAASFFILMLAVVVGSPWWIQSAAAVAMVAAAVTCARLRLPGNAKMIAALGMLGILLCTLPLLHTAAGPLRWVRLGSFSLYIAPAVIPLLLVIVARAAALSPLQAGAPEAQRIAKAGVLMLAALAWVLAIQPDFAQVLALSVAALPVIAYLPTRPGAKVALAVPFVLACLWAGLAPDRLEPVLHVEQVIRLAWTHSAWAGLWLSGSAALLILGPAWLLGRRHPAWLAIPAYYALLIAGSILDLTPAPLMGYGAGPLLGYGLMAGLAAASIAGEEVASRNLAAPMR